MTAEEYFKTSNPEWFDFISQGEYNMLIKTLQDFARLKCKEQRELCAKRWKRCTIDRYAYNYYDKILNSPEPET
jgi:beta-glucosidase/6-phospho-beta-glucosidase/beta-galactosidase